jgi:hypothetical protein
MGCRCRLIVNELGVLRVATDAAGNLLSYAN